jgi:hypothetical protein
MFYSFLKGESGDFSKLENIGLYGGRSGILFCQLLNLVENDDQHIEEAFAKNLNYSVIFKR